ncbi:hypothetical protein PPOP_2651 [Paenibacillus popilliae ATCC 14706]|uniref:Uncharacterized protein n=1 Tax=Paenibacillus popilliae ATCC 14706 TaxID=1212764 RepID=M9M2S9_PAEPP|nr:hypothetical protein PPOP_2651 [Paenibacillus popilliae ATCC 14706]
MHPAREMLHITARQGNRDDGEQRQANAGQNEAEYGDDEAVSRLLSQYRRKY